VSNIVTDPSKLPVTEITYGRLSTMIATVMTPDSNSSFWTASIANGGAYITNAVGANTWYTLANITGAGYMGNVISQANSAASSTVDIEITVDGALYTMTLTAQTTTSRAILGGVVGFNMTGSTLAPSSNSVLSNSYSGLAAIPELLGSGGMVLRFDTSLLVRVRGSSVYGSGLYVYAGVTYRLDG